VRERRHTKKWKNYNTQKKDLIEKLCKEWVELSELREDNAILAKHLTGAKTYDSIIQKTSRVFDKNRPFFKDCSPIKVDALSMVKECSRKQKLEATEKELSDSFQHSHISHI
jgi:hypothetical protein